MRSATLFFVLATVTVCVTADGWGWGNPSNKHSYAVSDKQTGDEKSAHEESDGGVTKGWYSLVQPDGITRTVNYIVTKEGGFQAQVINKGWASHPVTTGSGWNSNAVSWTSPAVSTGSGWNSNAVSWTSPAVSTGSGWNSNAVSWTSPAVSTGSGWNSNAVNAGSWASPAISTGAGWGWENIPQYKYSYAVSDKQTGDQKSAQEVRDGDVTKGSYTVARPDGVLQTVNYVATPTNGFQAQVINKGWASHPTVTNWGW